VVGLCREILAQEGFVAPRPVRELESALLDEYMGQCSPSLVDLRREIGMKGIAIVILVLISMGLGSGFQGPGEWIKYNSPKGRYSILLPGEPRLSSQEILTSNGKKVTQYRATASEANFAVFVGYYDYASAMTYSLNQARDGIVERTGTLLSESKISLEGHAGLEMNVSAKRPDGTEFLVRARIYDFDRRVYVLQFILPRSEDDNVSAEKAARYFDSFRVTTRP
jgi:hypothetical protein